MVKILESLAPLIGVAVVLFIQEIRERSPKPKTIPQPKSKATTRLLFGICITKEPDKLFPRIQMAMRKEK